MDAIEKVIEKNRALVGHRLIIPFLDTLIKACLCEPVSNIKNDNSNGCIYSKNYYKASKHMETTLYCINCKSVAAFPNYFSK